MRHQVHGKKLNRSVAHRKALYANLAQALVEHERITTTLAKAKAVRPVVERLVSQAKTQDLASRRRLGAVVRAEAAAKLYTVLGPRFAERPGGYTRIIKIGRRMGDATEMAVLEFVELSKPSRQTGRKEQPKGKTVGQKTRPSSRRQKSTADEAGQPKSTIQSPAEPEAEVK